MTFMPDNFIDDSPYTQCRLERVEGDRTEVRHSWIPAYLAVKEKVLTLKGSAGWRVTAVWETRNGDCLQGRMGTVYRIK